MKGFQSTKKDANHNEIVAAFEAYGATVVDLYQVGHGCPDILVGFEGGTHLVEIKDGEKNRSSKLLTPDQRVFFGLPLRASQKATSKRVKPFKGEAPYIVETTHDVSKMVERWRLKDTTDNMTPRLCVECREVGE